MSSDDHLESRIEAKASDYAKSLGMMTLKLNVKGQSGWPDRLYVWNGHVWFIEFKAPKQKPRPLQEHVINQLKALYVEVRVADNLIDAKEIINELYHLPKFRP